ncbi:dihydrofolate reductase family protein [Kribbella jejuensis]|uniref:dihydrofolate reductase family protein n=1 Tax=Kribbella jejuensis TaxID=236068 RepID=UPI0023523D9E|nr:dihydrofolate reductase family protein [Kribbella jejuensis]
MYDDGPQGASRWLDRTGAWADKLNSMPKYVVSSTVEHPRWGAGVVLNGDVVAQVAEVKRDVAGEIVVYASYQLVRSLIEHGLVDELRLFVFPVVLGGGERLFDGIDDRLPLRLAGARTLGVGLTFLNYEVVR